MHRGIILSLFPIFTPVFLFLHVTACTFYAVHNLSSSSSSSSLRRFIWPVKYTAWHRIEQTLLVCLIKFGCSVNRRHVCSIESHVAGWYAVSTDKDGCRRFERSLMLSSSASNSPRKYFGGLLSLHGVTSRKSGVLNSTAAPNSCSTDVALFGRHNYCRGLFRHRRWISSSRC